MNTYEREMIILEEGKNALKKLMGEKAQFKSPTD
jgi:hypothetical protein